MSTASATSTDTVILEDATESEVAEDVGEAPTMPSPVYASILREAPGEPHRDSSMFLVLTRGILISFGRSNLMPAGIMKSVPSTTSTPALCAITQTSKS
ncbi:hypothetical protein PI124_g16628 [Phytophthora idaei]|nr:hypothetical protein PI125_g22449 [Phytophthora idaei]KAG3134342.1 hypothetical protein PI126_g18727 [Phytophthora idaei]KAG3238410.1 hypothetical protein PI124_g16628 [Phytophthora idaei]